MHDFATEHCLFKQSEVALVENKDTWCSFLALIMHPVQGTIASACTKTCMWSSYSDRSFSKLKQQLLEAPQRQPWQSCISSRGQWGAQRQSLFCLMSLQFLVSKFIEPADPAYVTKICYLWTLTLPINYAWHSRLYCHLSRKGSEQRWEDRST